MKKMLLFFCIAFIVFASVQAYGSGLDDVIDEIINEAGGLNNILANIFSIGLRGDGDSLATMGAYVFKYNEAMV